jgi:hypothetical protein
MNNDSTIQIVEECWDEEINDLCGAPLVAWA